MKFNILLISLLVFTSSCYSQKKATKEDYSDDWAALYKYQQQNLELGLPKKGEKRVVFLGSSIFEFWKEKDPTYFEGKGYIDRGISGQISPQLLIRFRQDVIDLQPKAVIILAGSNDLAGSKGHVDNKVIMDNIRSMAELANLNGIKVILCKYLPIYEYPWNKVKAAESIIALNNEIETYAKANKFTILDYFTPLKDERNGQKAEWTVDGVHPNLKGYKVMEKVTDEVIKKVL
ncbi:GDSL-type esterase/lipase family protein [Pedobacter sp. AW1-32]|uniref:GDSL-type esterase/lipase family protein n=1 Tax=Pedobacter sp. AW1-32 TaxID=3383026 RepID=UPI003FED82C5